MLIVAKNNKLNAVRHGSSCNTGIHPGAQNYPKNLSAALQTVALAKDCRHDTYYISIDRTVVKKSIEKMIDRLLAFHIFY